MQICIVWDILKDIIMESHEIRISIESEYLEIFYITCNKIKCENNAIYADRIKIDFGNRKNPAIQVCQIDNRRYSLE
jgi:hypothetical protein